MECARRMKFPPGVYYTPTDDDLIQFYLKPKVLGQNLGFDVVENKQIYGPHCNPWQIFDPNDPEFWFVSPSKKTEKVRYVFTSLSKIGKGTSEEVRSRVNMSKRAGSGTWVGETGKDQIMDCEGNVIGETRLLIFKNNEIDPAAGEAQFGYYKMHEYRLSGIYGGFDGASTLVLCKITYDSSKKSSYVKNKSSVVHKKPTVAPKRVSDKSCKFPKNQKNKKNLEGGVGDHLVDGSVSDSLDGTVCDNLEGGHLVDGSVSNSLAGTVCDNLEGGARANLVGVQYITAFAEDIGLEHLCVDLGLEGSSGDNLDKGSAFDSPVGVQNITEFGEDLGLDHPLVNFCFEGSGGRNPVEGSVSDYFDGFPNMDEFGHDLGLDDLHVGFCFEDEWIQDLMNPIQEEHIQDRNMTNLGKRKFEAESSCVAKKVVLTAQLFCCTGQFIGHGYLVLLAGQLFCYTGLFIIRGVFEVVQAAQLFCWKRQFIDHGVFQRPQMLFHYESYSGFSCNC